MISDPAAFTFNVSLAEKSPSKMGREVELIKAAKMGDLRTLERHLVLNRRSTVIGR